MKTSAGFFNKLFLVTFTAFIVVNAHAAPTIDSVVGETAIGATLKISGSGFGTLGGAPFFYDQIDDSSGYPAITDGSAVPEDSGPWTHNSGIWGNKVTFKANDVRSNFADAVYYGYQKSYLGWPRAINTTTHDSLYVSWWYKPNQSVNNGGSNKFIRVWDDVNGKGTRISLTQMHMTYGPDGNLLTSWGTTQPDANSWNRFEIYVDKSSKEISVWLNGKVTHRVTNFSGASSTDPLTIGLIGFDPSVKDNYPNYSFGMTDIYASSTLARVELSESPIWDPTAHNEVQEISSWSNNAIEFNLDLFSYQSAEGLYLYVVDSDGNVNNNGYPISCSQCPDKPGSVSVQ